MYDDLTTLMHDATEGLTPPAGSAHRALRSAAASRRRGAALAGTGGVAALGLAAVGLAHLPADGRSSVRAASSPPDASATAPAPSASPSDLHSPFQGDEAGTTAPGGDAGFQALALPNALPGFPESLFRHPAADSYGGNDGDLVYVGAGQPSLSAHTRLWGWNAAPYATRTISPGIVEGTPRGPQLRLTVADRPDAYVPNSAGKIQDSTIDGRIDLHGRLGYVSHDRDDVYVSLTYNQFSIQAMGGNGATVDNLVDAIDAIRGLDGPGTTLAPQPTPRAHGSEAAPTDASPAPYDVGSTASPSTVASAPPAASPASSPPPSP